jgi:mannose-1-phosphate guanylyltransferase/mannose-6-phosphate isomerase
VKINKIYPIILSGGSGTRLWPESRLSFPKQFLKINSDYTLIQETLLRIKNKNIFHSPILICNDEHRFLIAEQLRELGIKPKLIVLEPLPKNTGPAVAIASYIVKEIEEKGKILILPSDHKINDIRKFQNIINRCQKICEENKIVTFGVSPNEPDSNFGYIKKGKVIDRKNKIYVVEEFKEKPTLAKAKKYLKNKSFFWNSGIFFCKANKMLNEISNHDKKTFLNSIKAIKKANKDLDFLRLSRKYFSQTISKPIDKSVLENSKDVVLKSFKVGWNDVGSWPSIYNLSKKNKQNNLLKGPIETTDVKNSIIHSENQQVLIIGQKGIVVVSTKDALLIMPNNKDTNIKKSIEKLSKINKEKILYHPKVYRPWGSFEVLLTEKNYQVKRLIINPKQKISLQKHLYRSENWIIIQGIAKVTKNNKNYKLNKNQSISIPNKTIHRVENIGKDPLIIIEVQSGERLLENDIIRLEDIYNRD